MDSDRRKYPRIASDQLVSFTPVAGAPALADAGDISLGGICIKVVGCKLSKGDLLLVNFNVGEQTIEAVGRLVRLKQMDDITAEIGLEFVRIDPWAARLLEEEMERSSEG
jgi:c-di-GMP-binding flagellar brake protein YcgR